CRDKRLACPGVQVTVEVPSPSGPQVASDRGPRAQSQQRSAISGARRDTGQKRDAANPQPLPFVEGPRFPNRPCDPSSERARPLIRKLDGIDRENAAEMIEDRAQYSPALRGTRVSNDRHAAPKCLVRAQVRETLVVHPEQSALLQVRLRDAPR